MAAAAVVVVVVAVGSALESENVLHRRIGLAILAVTGIRKYLVGLSQIQVSLNRMIAPGLSVKSYPCAVVKGALAADSRRAPEYFQPCVVVPSMVTNHSAF